MSSDNPTFFAFAVTCIVLCLNLLFLWVYSGVARGKTKTAANKEDAERFGAAFAEVDPPPVARVLRAHANAQANIYPFIVLALLFVLMGGGEMMAKVVFGVFVVARVAHTIVYLSAQQPWRSIAYGLGGLATGVLLVDDVLLLARGPVGR